MRSLSWSFPELIMRNKVVHLGSRSRVRSAALVVLEPKFAGGARSLSTPGKHGLT